MDNLIIIAILIIVIGLASLYVYKTKKNGRKCIGCPDGCSCSKKNCSACPDNK